MQITQMDFFTATSPIAYKYGEDWRTRSQEESRSATFGECAVTVRLRRTPDGKWWHSWSSERRGLRLDSSLGDAMIGPFESRDIAVDSLAASVLKRVSRRDRDSAPAAAEWLVDIRKHRVTAVAAPVAVESAPVAVESAPVEEIHEDMDDEHYNYLKKPWETHPAGIALRAAGLNNGETDWNNSIQDPCATSKSRILCWPLEIEWRHGHPVLILHHTAAADFPFVRRVEDLTGLKATDVSKTYYSHAVGLGDDAHVEELLSTLHLTTPRDVCMSVSMYCVTGRRTEGVNRLSPAAARRLLAAVGSQLRSSPVPISELVKIGAFRSDADIEDLAWNAILAAEEVLASKPKRASRKAA